MSQTSETLDSRKTQDRALRTRDLILQASLKEFADNGFEGTSIRRIAAVADVNHCSIQHHFGNKRNLWEATARYVFAEQEAWLEKRAEGLTGVSEGEFMRLMFREFMLFSANCPSLNRFMLQANQNEERMSWLVENMLKPSKLSYLTMIERAQKAGIFVSGDPSHLHYLFVAAATSIFAFGTEFKQVTGNNPFDQSVIDKHIDLVLSVFLRP
eukprot:s1_g1917.t1